MIDLTPTKLVIWDFDGTLIDSFGVFSEVLREAASLSGHSAPDEVELRKHFHGALDESIKTALNMVDGEDAVIVLNDFLKIQNEYYAEPEPHIYADALQLSRRLHEAGIQQVIVTNRDHAGRGNGSPRNIVSHSSLAGLIDEVVCGDDVEYRKPDARSLSTSKLYQSVKPDEVLVIGDQFVDAELARNLRCSAVLVNRSEDPVVHLERLGEDLSFVHIVKSLDDV